MKSLVPLALIALCAVSPFTTIPPPPVATWTWPTQGAHDILRDYRAPATPWGAGHRGLDIRASSHDLFAPTSGVVSYSGFVVNRGVLTLRTDTGMLVSFEPVVAVVPSSTRVIQGELIGEIQEGHCERLCVHLGLRDRGEYRSARWELGIVQRSVLVPWEAQWKPGEG